MAQKNKKIIIARSSILIEFFSLKLLPRAVSKSAIIDRLMKRQQHSVSLHRYNFYVIVIFDEDDDDNENYENS